MRAPKDKEKFKFSSLFVWGNKTDNDTAAIVNNLSFLKKG